MLTSRQVVVLLLVSLLLWGGAALYIRLFPELLLDPWLGGISFVTTLPVAWASVWIIRRAGRLAPDQLLAGVCIVGAVAMMIDGLVIHWAPGVYGASETIVRLGGAWLLWGYGVSLGIALLMRRAMAQAA